MRRFTSQQDAESFQQEWNLELIDQNTEALVACRMQKSEAKEIATAAANAKKEKSVWMRETLLQAARAERP